MLDNDFFSHNSDRYSFNISEPESEETMIPVIEEFASVSKKVIETGKVTVTKTVKETTEDIDVSLLSNEYVIEHIAIDRYIDEELPKARQEGDTFILPVLKEVIVKRVLLVEEVRITRKTTERTEPQIVTLRKELITVIRTLEEDK